MAITFPLGDLKHFSMYLCRSLSSIMCEGHVTQSREHRSSKIFQFRCSLFSLLQPTPSFFAATRLRLSHISKLDASSTVLDKPLPPQSSALMAQIITPSTGVRRLQTPTASSASPSPAPDVSDDSDEWEYEYSTTETEVNHPTRYVEYY